LLFFIRTSGDNFFAKGQRLGFCIDAQLKLVGPQASHRLSVLVDHGYVGLNQIRVDPEDIIGLRGRFGWSRLLRECRSNATNNYKQE
jgi:hypothetical protein